MLIDRQRLVKQVPEKMNTHKSIEELPYPFNGNANTPL
jgi:hypothetical protein